MSGSTSGLPYGVFSRNGNTWFITANEPLSYEPAGSSVVTLSVVPMVSVPPAASVLPPPPAVQPASARAAAEARGDRDERRDAGSWMRMSYPSTSSCQD